MRAILLASLLIVSQPVPGLGQTAGNTAGSARRATTLTLGLGTVSIALPPPDGFDEAASQSEALRTYFSATEDPANEMMAVHLPTDAVEGLKRGEPYGMDFYTKVSVQRNSKERDFSAADFASIISMFEQRGVKLLDFSNPPMKEKIKRLEDTVHSMSGSKMSMGQPQLLGEFDRTPNVYSVMMMARLSIQSGAGVKQVQMMCAASFVRVKSRLIYVYSYRRYNSDADVGALKDFAKKWTAQIVVANQA